MSYNAQLTTTGQLPLYEHPPPWIPIHQREGHPDYDSDLRNFLPRKIILRRNHAAEQKCWLLTLGFNIRGGKEHLCGIYISKVMPNSEADRLGLQEADQILLVNEYNFEDISHNEAVKVLKMNTNIEMVLRYFPYGYNCTYDKGRTLSSPPPLYR